MWLRLLVPEEEWYLLLVVVINQSQVWVKPYLVFITFRHNPWNLSLIPSSEAIPKFLEQKQKSGDASVGGVASFSADQEPRVVTDFAESPSGPAVLPPGHGQGGQGSTSGFFTVQTTIHSLLTQPFHSSHQHSLPANVWNKWVFFKALLETPWGEGISGMGLKPPQALGVCHRLVNKWKIKGKVAPGDKPRVSRKAVSDCSWDLSEIILQNSSFQSLTAVKRIRCSLISVLSDLSTCL